MEASGTKGRTLFLAQFGIMLAILVIVAFTPLGSLPAIGPIVATTVHVPIIITAILLGWKAGTAMGFIGGLLSVIVWTFMPPNPFMAFVFSPFFVLGAIDGAQLVDGVAVVDVVEEIDGYEVVREVEILRGSVWSLAISIVPRTAIGFVSGITFGFLQKRMKGKKEAVAYITAGVLGTLANTFGVLGGIWLFFAQSFAIFLGVGVELVLGILGGIVLFSGIPEAVLGAVCAWFICRPVKKYVLKDA